jgi:hypothetical protein
LAAELEQRKQQRAEYNKHQAKVKLQERRKKNAEQKIAQKQREASRAKRAEINRRQQQQECRRKYGPSIISLDDLVQYEKPVYVGTLVTDYAKHRRVYIARENDTPRYIATRFGVETARVLYDNRRQFPEINACSKLRRYTTIVLPLPE